MVGERDEGHNERRQMREEHLLLGATRCYQAEVQCYQMLSAQRAVSWKRKRFRGMPSARTGQGDRALTGAFGRRLLGYQARYVQAECGRTEAVIGLGDAQRRAVCLLKGHFDLLLGEPGEL